MNLERFQFLGISRNFSASIGSFQGLPAELSEVILLSQRLALKYNTTPRGTCQHFLTSFFQFLCVGGWRQNSNRNEPSQASLRDASSPEGGALLALTGRCTKAPPFGGAGAGAPERVRPLLPPPKALRIGGRCAIIYYIHYRALRKEP